MELAVSVLIGHFPYVFFSLYIATGIPPLSHDVGTKATIIRRGLVVFNKKIGLGALRGFLNISFIAFVLFGENANRTLVA